MMILLSIQLSILWNLEQKPQDFRMILPETARPITTAKRIDQNQTVNVLFGMQGNNEAFIDDWEVALKSILLNAPIDASLHVHILANYVARVAVSEKIHNARLLGTRWRNPVTITVYDVEQYENEWMAFIRQKIRKGNKIDRRVKLGGYYRLLAFKIIPPSVGPIIYMDTDVVLLTNMNSLWKLVDREKVIQLSTKQICSGFMILHMEKFDLFWSKLDTLPNITHGGDQSLVIDFSENFPESVGNLPDRWDAHLGHLQKMAHRLLTTRPNGTGYIHFNGERPDSETYWTQGLLQYCIIHKCNRPTPMQKLPKPHHQNKTRFVRHFESTWGLADYYINVAWPWLLYFCEDTIGFDEEGHILRFEIIEGTAHQ